MPGADALRYADGLRRLWRGAGVAEEGTEGSRVRARPARELARPALALHCPGQLAAALHHVWRLLRGRAHVSRDVALSLRSLGCSHVSYAPAAPSGWTEGATTNACPCPAHARARSTTDACSRVAALPKPLLRGLPDARSAALSLLISARRRRRRQGPARIGRDGPSLIVQRFA